MHPFATNHQLACPGCDTLFELASLEEGERAICPHCLATLQIHRRNSLHRTAAFAMAAAVLFLVANCFPFLTLRAGYRESQMHLWQSALGLEEEGSPYLAGAISIFIELAPALLIGGLLYLTLPLLWNRRGPGAITICRAVVWARRWNMVEVFLVGVLVSLLKLGKLATLTLGISFWAFIVLIFCLTAALASIHPRELWARLETAK
ncbi:MAG: paraquat-inducible protein A [Spartobacteria bacterium]